MENITNVDKLRIREIEENLANDKVLTIDNDGLMSFKGLNYIEFATIEDLEAYSGKCSSAVVSDPDRGGLFVKKQDGEPDNGLIFEDLDGSKWHRVYNSTQGVNVRWYGVDENNVQNNADLIIQIIKDKNISLIVFPKGVYKINKQIGTINPADRVPVDVDRDLTILGYGATIELDTNVDQHAVIGLETENCTVRVEGITILGNNSVNRSIYIRNLNNDLAGEVHVSNCVIKDTSATQGVTYNVASAICLFGNLRSASVTGCYIDNVVVNNSSHVAQAVMISSQNSDVIKSFVFGNTIKNVYRSNNLDRTNLDGIYIGGKNKNIESNSSTLIEANTIINARGRAIKVQKQNTTIKGNTIVIEDGFDMGLEQGALSYINVQYHDCLIIGNSFVIDGNVDLNATLIGISNSSKQAYLNRCVISNNKVFYRNKISSFIYIYEPDTLDSYFVGNIIIENNSISAEIDNFIAFTTSQTQLEYTSLVINGNSIKKINNFLLRNNQGRLLDITASYNYVENGVAIISNNNYKLTSINNKGLEINNNVIKSDITDESIGAEQVLNIISLTQSDYDSITPNEKTLYIIKDA